MASSKILKNNLLALRLYSLASWIMSGMSTIALISQTHVSSQLFFTPSSSHLLVHFVSTIAIFAMIRLLIQKYFGSFQTLSAKTMILLSHGIFSICWILLGLMKVSLFRNLIPEPPNRSVDQPGGVFSLCTLVLLIHSLIPCAFSMTEVCHEVVEEKMHQEYETTRASEQQLESAEATSSLPPRHQGASQRVEHNKHFVSSRWNIALSVLCLVAALLSMYFLSNGNSHLFVSTTSREFVHQKGDLSTELSWTTKVPIDSIIHGLIVSTLMIPVGWRLIPENIHKKDH